MSSEKKRKVEKTIEIAAPVSAVWKAITESEELTRWFPLDAEVNPGVGGKIRISWGDKYKWVFKIEAWMTEKHLRLVYNHETDLIAKDQSRSDKEQKMIPGKSDELAVDYYLEARAGKTTLRLVHSGFGADASWDEEYDGVRRGWNTELNNLKHYLERHHGEDRKVVWVWIPFEGSLQSAWQKLMGENGFVHQGSLTGLSDGDTYKIEAVTGEIFEGKILYFNPPTDFSATVKNLNDSVLRVQIEQYQGRREASVWLSAYGLPESQLEGFEKRWSERLNQLFSDHVSVN